MTMIDKNSILLNSQQSSGNNQSISVGPKEAGWDFIGLSVISLTKGESISRATGTTEAGLVALSGIFRIKTASSEYQFGDRASIFDGQPWALYLPVNTEYEVTVLESGELAICSAEAEPGFPEQLITPEDVMVEIRGAGNAARQINHIIKPEFAADRLLIVEVFTPNGNWSSYPPHKHDVENRPAEADLEEIYYYRIDPADGFAFQRLCSADRSFDEPFIIHDGDLMLVPEGYHTFVVAHGYTGYYLNVLAGHAKPRTMQPSDDPDLAWVRDTWTDAQNQEAASWREVDERINKGAGHRK